LMAPFCIFVDGVRVSADAGQTTLDAIAAWRPDVALSLRNESRALSDSRGLVTDPESAAYAGAIFRVVGARQLRTTDETSPE